MAADSGSIIRCACYMHVVAKREQPKVGVDSENYVLLRCHLPCEDFDSALATLYGNASTYGYSVEYLKYADVNDFYDWSNPTYPEGSPFWLDVKKIVESGIGWLCEGPGAVKYVPGKRDRCVWLILACYQFVCDVLPGVTGKRGCSEWWVPNSDFFAAREIMELQSLADGMRVFDILRVIRFHLDDWDYELWPRRSTERKIVRNVLKDGRPWCRFSTIKAE